VINLIIIIIGDNIPAMTEMRIGIKNFEIKAEMIKNIISKICDPSR